jgi:hypothetical protein
MMLQTRNIKYFAPLHLRIVAFKHLLNYADLEDIVRGVGFSHEL